METVYIALGNRNRVPERAFEDGGVGSFYWGQGENLTGTESVGDVHFWGMRALAEEPAMCELLELARKQFGESLSESEAGVIKAASVGDACGYGGWADVQAPLWEAESKTGQVVRSKVVRWLCSDSAAKSLVRLQGLIIRGFVFEELLDLSMVRAPFPLVLQNCVLRRGIVLTFAELALLDLSQSRTGPVLANGVEIARGLFLNGLECHGWHIDGLGGKCCISLQKAIVRSEMSVIEARLVAGDGVALCLRGATVEGGVSMPGLWAEGELDFQEIAIAGTLDMTDVHVASRGRVAVTLDRAHVGKALAMCGDFRALGQVRLAGAMVNDVLHCSGCWIVHDGDFAVMADAVRVGSQAAFDGARIGGGVRMAFARLEGHFGCTAALLVSGSKPALDIQVARIGGSVFLDEGFCAHGEVSVLGAMIGGDLDCTGGRFLNAGAKALSADGAQIGSRLLMHSGFEVRGELRLFYVKVPVLKDEVQSWPTRGNLCLEGFSYDFMRPASAESGLGNRLQWIERQYPQERSRWRGSFCPHPYTELARAYRRMGMPREARKALIGKHKHERRHGTMSRRRKAGDWFLGFVVGHGYAMWRVLIFAGILFAVTWAAVAWGNAQGLMVRSGDSVGPLPLLYPFVYALDALVPFVDLHQESNWVPDAAEGAWHTGFLLQVLIYVNIISGWVLLTAAIAGLANVVKHESE